MFGLKKEKAGIVYGVLFDIGSESVGVAIVESDQEKGQPTIVFSHRVYMRINKKILTPAERIRFMREALFSASLIISREGIQALTAHNSKARVSEILITVSAPWSYTLARSVKYNGEKELKITRALLDDLVASAESEISEQLATLDNQSDVAYDVVERATVDVRINDYTVRHPLGLHGKDISLVHVTGVIPSDILGAVREVEEKIFPGTTVRSHTFLLVLYCVLRDLFAEHDALTIVHVTGESTEFGVVDNGTLIESISIPVGLNTIVRGLMDKRDLTPQALHGELKLYHEHHLAPDREKEIEAELDAYRTAISEKITVDENMRRFPIQAFVLAPFSFTELFTDVLKPVLNETLGITKEILTLPAEKLTVGSGKEGEDPSIAISSRFFHKLHGCGEIESL